MKPLRHLVPLVLAGLFAISCSSDKKTWLSVDVQLGAGVDAPEKVQLSVDGPSGAPLTSQEVAWSKAVNGVLKLALSVPVDGATTVSVAAKGITGAQVTSSASKAGVAIQKDQENGPITLELKAGGITTPDGGTDAETPVDGGSSDLNTSSPDTAQTVPDGGSDTPVGTDATPPTDTAPDTTATDVSTPDTAPDVTPISTRAWSTPINVQNADPSNVCYPQVAVAPVSGNAVVMWIEEGMGVFVIHYNAATAKWTAPISVFAKGLARIPAIAVDGAGNFTAVWTQDYLENDTTPTGIYASTSADGTHWSTPKLIAANGQAKPWYNELRVAMNRSGQARLVWQEGTNPQIYDQTEQRLYSLYLSATPKLDLLDKCSGSDCESRVAIDSNGNGLVVWTNPDKSASPKTSIWAARFSKDQLQPNELVETYDVADADTPQVSINASGRGMVVWQQGGASSYDDIYARRYSTSLGWVGEAAMVAHVYAAGNMSLVVNSQDTAILGWGKLSSSKFNAMLSTQPPSESWTTVNRETDNLAPGYTSTDVDPIVNVDGSGDLLMSWRKKIDNSTITPQLAWQIDGTWTQAEIGKVADMFAAGIRTGVADNGQAVAAWTYYFCNPEADQNAKICPNAKKWDALAAESKAVWGNVFVSVYR
jgi:hypothetical protein